MADDDKKRLEAAAKAISSILKSKFSGSRLSFYTKLTLFEGNFGGWGISITKPIDHIPEFQIYLDHLPGGQDRTFWYGFHSQEPDAIKKIITLSGLQISRRKISESDLRKTKNKLSLMKPLSKADMKLPIQESYETEPDYFIGSYIPLSSKDSDIPLREAIRFFSDLVATDSEIKINSEVKSELEGFRGLATKQVIQRATKLVNQFLLEKDGNLRCDLCSFDPEKRIVGTNVKARSLLDVHHTTPLSEGERYTKIDSLQLLCPTCHRFEHAKMRTDATQ